jgi:superfamily II DNA or RNA helicase
MSILRPYQVQGLLAFREALSPDVNRVALEMATGLGKTVTGAQAAVDFLTGQWDSESMETHGDRVLVIVHTDEICAQWVEKLEFAVARGGHPFAVGVVKATRNEPTADIVVASVQTLAVPGRREQITDVGFVIVDEAHHAVAPSYVAALEHFGALSPMVKEPGCDMGADECACERPTRPTVPTLGLSATLARSDGQGLGRVWQDMPFSRNLLWGIRKGYLIDLVPYTIKIPDLDTSTDAGLDQTLADGIAPEAVVQAWLEKIHDLPRYRGQDGYPTQWPSTVLFAPLVKSAEAFAAEFNEEGVKAEVVHGKMVDAEVEAVLARYEAGVTTVVCNAMKLTEGWDSPRTMCVIVARRSRGPLFVQMAGRGVRPWLGAEAPPREDQRCVLLCVQGAAEDINVVADLSDRLGEVRDGVSFLAQEDEWDLGRDIPSEATEYRGPVQVERWDPLVQASSKAWTYTEGGVPFLPTAKRSQGYVFLVEVAGAWEVWGREVGGPKGRPGLAYVARMGSAPDLELAMAVAEDEAQERGGDVGALLADKGRAWRKAKPSEELIREAVRAGVPSRDIERVLASKASGKAGKLSDLVSRVKASKALDHNAVKIKERGSK